MAAYIYQPTYHASLALVIGIDCYTALPQLNTAVHGAQAVAGYLRDGLGFTITEYYDDAATRENILRWFNRLKPDPDDRVLVYFAGHGVTRQIGKRTEGYLALANSDGYWNSLAMEDIVDEAEALPAKHVLFLLDACFSGLTLRGRSAEFDAERTAEYLLTRAARYAITAGGEEVVDDDAAGEYSLFTHYLLAGLTDPALSASGLLRARNLGLYLEEHVSAHRRSRALPNHGPLVGSADGDFLFHWETGPRLPLDLESALRSEVAEVRWGAVAGLINLAKDPSHEVSSLARVRLQTIAESDPDKRVRRAARSLFEEEETLQQAEEQHQRRAEEAAALEEARRQREEAERAMQEAEARMAELRRIAEEKRASEEAAEVEREKVLEKALRSRQITPMRDTTEQLVALKPRPEAVPTPDTPTSRGRWALLAIGVIALAGLIVGGYFLARPLFTPTISGEILYDDFNDPALEGTFDSDRWEASASTDTTFHSFEQHKRTMVIVQESSTNQWTNLIARRFWDTGLDGPTFFEASMMLEPGGKGMVVIEVDLDGVWYGECNIRENNSALCKTWTVPSTSEFWFPEGILIDPGSWHTFRINVYPETATFEFIVDGRMLASRTLENTAMLSNLNVTVQMGVWGQSAIGHFDDFRYGPIK